MADKELVDYFISQTDKRFDELEKKLDELISFRWALVGASIGVSSFFTILFNILILIYGGK